MALCKHHGLQCANKNQWPLKGGKQWKNNISFFYNPQSLVFPSISKFPMAEMYVQVFSIKQLQINKYTAT